MLGYSQFKKKYEGEFSDFIIDELWRCYQNGRIEGFNKAMDSLSRAASVWCEHRKTENRKEILELDEDFMKK